MRRIPGWLWLGLPAVGLMVAFLGQAVLGQNDTKPPILLPSPPISAPEVAKPRELPSPPDLPSVIPPLPDTPPAPKPGTGGTTVIVQSSPALPANDKLERLAPLNGGASKQQPAVSVEWIMPTTVRVQQPLIAQLLVKNVSTSVVHQVAVRHRPNPGVTCKSSDPQPANDGGELVWQLGSLAPGQTRLIEMRLVTAARGTFNCQANVTFTTIAAHQVQVQEPQLAVKMRIPEKVIAGENVTLHYTISNTGDGACEAVKIKTTLPEGIDHPRGRIIEFDVGTIGPKEIRAVQLVCHAKGQGIQRCAVEAIGEGSLVANDICQFEILMPRLDLTVIGPRMRYLDRPAVYTVKVSNPGSAPATNVEVQELIPAGFKFHQAHQGGQYHEGSRVVHWTLGDLQPGQTKEVTVDLVPIETGEYRVIAHAKATRGLKSEAQVSTQVEGLPSLAVEVGAVDDPIEVGAETAFEIRVVNNGTKTETNVQVVCVLPDQLDFRGARCSTALKHQLRGRELVFEPLPKLAPKADVFFRVQVKGNAAADVRFQTKIRADSMKDPVLREQSMRVYSDGASSVPATPTPAPITTPALPPLPAPPAPVATPPAARVSDVVVPVSVPAIPMPPR